jgi:transposase
MFFPESQVSIWLYAKPTDMRRSFNGLAAMAKNLMGEDPLSGHAFVFINRRQTQIKILYFDRSGYCIWAKRLEQGRFNYNRLAGDKQALNWTELKLIIEGIELRNTQQRKRYSHPQSRQSGIIQHHGNGLSSPR